MGSEFAALENTIKAIQKTDENARAQARARLDSLVKPIGSLGGLEEIAVRLAGITGSVFNVMDKRCVIIMSADNGVVAEGVASAPQAVTYLQTLNFAKGLTGVSVLASTFNADLAVYDVGINADIDYGTHKGIIVNNKIRKSTGNIAKEPAMTKDEVIKAIHCGVKAAVSAKEKGYKIIGVGEMGIGNTTTSSAVLSALLGFSTKSEVGDTVDRGAGLTDAAYERKIEVIYNALSLHKPDRGDVYDILSTVGGLDIAAMTGVFLGAATLRMPVVIDGFISVVAALCAARLNPLAVDYMLASHKSEERGYLLAVKELGLKPYLHLNMRLGEGSGCPIMFSIIDAACAVIEKMATFEEAQIDTEFLEELEG